MSCSRRPATCEAPHGRDKTPTAACRRVIYRLAMSRLSTHDESVAVVTGAEALALHDALNRMHVRDRERVIAGELSAEALHFIPAEMARNSVVRWTDAAVRRFKR